MDLYDKITTSQQKAARVVGLMFLAIIAIAAIREKLRTAAIPAPMRGLGMAFLLTGLMGIAFMSLTGINPADYMK